MAGTIEFEKYNSGDAYKTSFYTLDIAMTGNVVETILGTSTTFAEMYSTDAAKPFNTVRSYELYIDTATDSDKKQTTRIAKVTKDVTNIVDYDYLVTNEPDLSTGVSLAGFEITVKNLSVNPVDMRLVVVCEAKDS